jgi:uncharacterized protein YbjT (DUF2867 family)
MHTILVLGGYGFFGKRIADRLIGDAGIQLLIGGRNPEKAEAAHCAFAQEDCGPITANEYQ